MIQVAEHRNQTPTLSPQLMFCHTGYFDRGDDSLSRVSLRLVEWLQNSLASTADFDKLLDNIKMLIPTPLLVTQVDRSLHQRGERRSRGVG